jgi:hypothetical protein
VRSLVLLKILFLLSSSRGSWSSTFTNSHSFTGHREGGVGRKVYVMPSPTNACVGSPCNADGDTLAKRALAVRLGWCVQVAMSGRGGSSKIVLCNDVLYLEAVHFSSCPRTIHELGCKTIRLSFLGVSTFVYAALARGESGNRFSVSVL